MQFINFNETTLQNNSVGVDTKIKLDPKPTVYWVYVEDESDIKLVVDYWSKCKDVTKKGENSQSKKNSRSSDVTPTEDAGDDFARLTYAVSRPTMHKRQTKKEEKQSHQELQSEVADCEENADFDDLGKTEKFDAAFEALMMLEQSWIISFEYVNVIMAYVEKKLAEGPTS